jgi:hypothetical protein
MHLLPRLISRYQQPSDSSRVPELSPGTEISSLRGKHGHPKATCSSMASHCSFPVGGSSSKAPICSCAVCFSARRGSAPYRVSPLRESTPFRGRTRHRRGWIARPRAGPHAPRELNNPNRRWGRGLGRRRSTGRGLHTSTVPDEPSRGFLPRRPGQAVSGFTTRRACASRFGNQISRSVKCAECSPIGYRRREPGLAWAGGSCSVAAHAILMRRLVLVPTECDRQPETEAHERWPTRLVLPTPA